MKAQDIRTLTALALSKGHMEALRRIQLAFEKEIHDSNIRHHCTAEKYEQLQTALDTISEVFKKAETSIDTSYDNLKFNLEHKLEKEEKANQKYTLVYEVQTKDDIVQRDYIASLEEVKQRFKHVVQEAYDDGVLHYVVLYIGENTDEHSCSASGFFEVQEYLSGEAK